MAKQIYTTDGFGQRLRAARLEAELTQEELELLTGMAPTWVSQLEHGRRLPSLPTFALLVRWIGCSADTLLMGDR
jgi:transcriptional regulator with XRE-family HTH domain